MLAVKLERQLPKTEILNRYLNAVYFGRGAYGVEAASKTYFGKDVGSLTLPEAAYLAGLIRSPETADAALPTSDPGAASGLATAKFRRTSVLDNMVKQHYITQAQRDLPRWPRPGPTCCPRRQGASTSTVTHTELGTQYLLDYVAPHAGGVGPVQRRRALRRRAAHLHHHRLRPAAATPSTPSPRA